MVYVIHGSAKKFHTGNNTFTEKNWIIFVGLLCVVDVPIVLCMTKTLVVIVELVVEAGVNICLYI